MFSTQSSRFPSRFLAAALLSAGLAVATPAAAQDNVVDLRAAELNSSGDLTYQNFIYARTLRDGRVLLEALLLRQPYLDYNEFSIGAGIRVGRRADVQAYALVHVAAATDAKYVQPALFVQDAAGRFTWSMFVEYYAPVTSGGIQQFLIDPLEAQYAVRGPLTLGGSVYLWRAEGGTWLTKAGPKVGVTDKYGTTEFRVTRTNEETFEFQIRRIVIF